MRSYPIWNKVQACIYKSSKDWGAIKASQVDIKVGSSGSNSHDFVTIKTTHKKHKDGSREFRFYLDGVCKKRALVTVDHEFKTLEVNNV
tara:strand:- start:391 stop:657 length:267 start_codon:yes stop_codon:yes gene_type:complete